MKINVPLQLLGNISPAEFMAKYWQKKPLLVRAAVTDKSGSEALSSLPSRSELFELASQGDVPSRLVELKKAKWRLTQGPFGAGATKLPALKTPDWTVLVQGVDLMDAATHNLLQQFRFIPDARLDDAMFSFATTGWPDLHCWNDLHTKLCDSDVLTPGNGCIKKGSQTSSKPGLATARMCSDLAMAAQKGSPNKLKPGLSVASRCPRSRSGDEANELSLGLCKMVKMVKTQMYLLHRPA